MRDDVSRWTVQFVDRRCMMMDNDVWCWLLMRGDGLVIVVHALLPDDDV